MEISKLGLEAAHFESLSSFICCQISEFVAKDSISLVTFFVKFNSVGLIIPQALPFPLLLTGNIIQHTIL
jgi:hypothetical protein